MKERYRRSFPPTAIRLFTGILAITQSQCHQWELLLLFAISCTATDCKYIGQAVHLFIYIFILFYLRCVRHINYQPKNETSLLSLIKIYSICKFTNKICKDRCFSPGLQFDPGPWCPGKSVCDHWERKKKMIKD